MYLLLGRLFLLFLLGCDWAGDPYFGQSPLSRPMASQEAFCHSLVHRTVLCREIAAVHAFNPLLDLIHPAQLGLGPSPLCPGWESEHFPLAATDPLCALMSLQC